MNSILDSNSNIKVFDSNKKYEKIKKEEHVEVEMVGMDVYVQV